VLITQLYEEGDLNPCDLRQQILSLPPLVTWSIIRRLKPLGHPRLEAPPRIELGLRDSKSHVLTVILWGQIGSFRETQELFSNTGS